MSGAVIMLTRDELIARYLGDEAVARAMHCEQCGGGLAWTAKGEQSCGLPGVRRRDCPGHPTSATICCDCLTVTIQSAGCYP